MRRAVVAVAIAALLGVTCAGLLANCEPPETEATKFDAQVACEQFVAQHLSRPWGAGEFHTNVTTEVGHKLWRVAGEVTFEDRVHPYACEVRHLDGETWYANMVWALS